jgi:transcriptional regulator with XRE-family HTH domain
VSQKQLRNQQFAKELREWAKVRGFNMRQLARMMDVSYSTIRSWMDAARVPNREHSIKLANLLGVPKEVFFDALSTSRVKSLAVEQEEALRQVKAEAERCRARLNIGSLEEQAKTARRLSNLLREEAALRKLLDQHYAGKKIPVLREIQRDTPLKEQPATQMIGIPMPEDRPDCGLLVDHDSLSSIGIDLGDIVLIRREYNWPEPGALAVCFDDGQAVIRHVEENDIQQDVGRLFGVVVSIIKQVPKH